MSELDDFSSPASAAVPQPSSDLDSISSPGAGPTTQQRAVVGAGDNPEESSKALAIAKKTSIPPSVVQTDLPGFDAHAKRQDAIKYTSGNPFIASYVDGHPMAASVSADDYPALQKSSEAVQALHPSLVGLRSILNALTSTTPADDDHGFVAETSRAANSAIDKVTALSGRSKMGVIEGLLTTGRAAMAPLEFLSAGLTGAVRSFGGRVLNEADLALRAPAAALYGEDKVHRPTFEESAHQAELLSMVAPIIGFAPKRVIGGLPGAPLRTAEDLEGAARGAATRAEIDEFLKSQEARAAHAESGGAALDKAVEVAQESKTKERSPDLYAQSVEAHDPGNVHIDGKKIVELYEKEGKVPTEGDGLLGFVPDLATKMNDAAASGGEITVPISQYLAHVDPSVHEGLKDSIRLHEDGVTGEEAKAAKETGAQNVSQERLTTAAVKVNDKIYEGTIHADALQKAADDLKTDVDSVIYFNLRGVPEENYNGFLTDKGRFVGRKEAAQIASRAEQSKFKNLGENDKVGIEDLKPDYNKTVVAPRTTDPIEAAVIDQVAADKAALGIDTGPFLNMVFKGGDAVDITSPEFKKYSEKIARMEQAVLDKAVAVHRAQIAKALTPEWKRNEAAVRDEVTTEFRDRGAFAAERYLRQNKIELGGDRADEIADGLAPLFGFDNGNALRDALTGLETEQAASGRSLQTQLKDAIKTETALRMESRYGNLAENIAKEARQIALSDHVFDILADEVRILADASGISPPLSRTELTDWARQSFERSGVQDASNWQKMQRAVMRGGREAEKALLKGDFQEAFMAKQRQMLAATVAKESLAFAKVVDQTNGRIEKFSEDRVVKSVDQEFTEQIRKMLDSVGVPNQFDPLVPTGSLSDFVVQSEGQLAVAPWLAEKPIPIKEMTVAQYREFADSLKSMEHVGRNVKKLESARGSAELENVVGDIVKSLERFPFIDQPNHPSLAQRAGSVWRKVIGSHLLVERILDYTDKFDPHGPLTEWLDRPLRDANSKEITLTEEVTGMLKGLRKHVDASLNDQIPNNLIPDSKDKTGFLNMTRNELRTLMLNMGNWSNLKKTAGGFGVNEADLRRFVDKNATASDVAWVNGIWKIFEHLKPYADEVQFKDTGVPVDKIEAVPWKVKGGKLDGGYYPLSYDPYNSDIQGRIAQPLFDRGYFTASTPHAYTKARTDYEGAIDLTGVHLAGKIQGMVHDIAFRLPVRNANKLISNQEFKTTMAQRWGKEIADLLPGWLRDIANSHNLDDNYAKDFVRAAGLIRQNVVSSLIAYNSGTFIKHGFTAAVMSMDRVGLVNLLKAMQEIGVKGAGKNLSELISKSDRMPDEAFMQAFRDAIDQGQRGENARQFVLDSSPVMRGRQRQYDESIRGAVDAINQIGIAKTLADFRQRQIHYGRMAVAFSDQMSAMPTWLAAYKKAYLGGESHEDAVFIADKEVSRAHGSNFVGDRPAITRIGNSGPGEVAKWFTNLYNFFGHQMNNQAQLVWDAAAYLRGSSQGMTEPGANAASIMRRVGLVMAIIWIEEAASPAKDDHGHGPLTSFALSALRTLGGGIVGVREFTNGLAGGYEPSTGMIGTLFKGIHQSVEDLKKASGTKAGATKNWIMHTATTLGFLTGVGGAQLGRTGQFLKDVATGQDRPQSLDDWRQGLRTGHSKARIFK
jgi:hypothetical protein